MRKGWMRASLATGVCGAAAFVLWAGSASAAPLAIVLHTDRANTAVNTPVTLHVTANDTITGGTAVLSISSAPGHGSASVSGLAIVYSPSSGFNGLESFSYRVCIGSTCATAAVDVQVGSATTTPYGGGAVAPQSTGTSTTSTQSTSSGGALPFTGTSDALLGLLGAACLGGGYACYRAGRDRARSALR
jgi:large repetitive protein